MLAESARSTSAPDCSAGVMQCRPAGWRVLRPAPFPRKRWCDRRFTAAGDSQRCMGFSPTRLGRPLLEVAGGRSLEQRPVRGEPGAMQRAVPGLLEVVEAHNAA